MAIFLGIDGGGSKTSSLIGDENSILGRGTAAGSNVVRVGEVPTREALAAAIRQACGAAHIVPAQITRTCIGVAGAARPQISQTIQRLLTELVPGEIEVVGDMVIALEAAFDDGPGVIVIAGTGSIAYGRNASGQTARAGGWGFAISDEGSGHWIGRAAVAAVLRACDRRWKRAVREFSAARQPHEILESGNSRAIGHGRQRHAASRLCRALSRSAGGHRGGRLRGLRRSNPRRRRIGRSGRNRHSASFPRRQPPSQWPCPAVCLKTAPWCVRFSTIVCVPSVAAQSFTPPWSNQCKARWL